MPINLNYSPLVSIIMNCYNGEDYLAEAVKSILSQTYKNFEVIFWDNQSKDKSAIIYKNFNDKRLKYYYAKKRTSLYQARNLAIKKSKGELIAFLDVDDIWLKNKLSLQIKKLRDKKIGLVYSNYFIFNQTTSLKEIAYTEKLPDGIIFNELFKNYFVGMGSVIIRKEIFTINKQFFDIKYNIIGDFDFFIRISKKIYFSYIQDPLLIYRIHKESFSNKNYQMHINELKLWIKKQRSLDNNHIFFIRQKIIYMEIILNILNKEYTLFLKKIFKISSLKKKTKLIILLLVPNFIFKILTSIK